MNEPLILGSIALLIVLVGTYIYFWRKEKKMYQSTPDVTASSQVNISESNSRQAPLSNPNLLPLQLQAYERLVILTERIALPNLLIRVPPEDLNIKDYESLLINQIRTEFDYNLSQQLYVSTEAWQAVTGLRDQNIFILNQISSGLNPNTLARDFVHLIQELLNKDSNVSLHTIVLEAIQYEVRKLMTPNS